MRTLFLICFLFMCGVAFGQSGATQEFTIGVDTPHHVMRLLGSQSDSTKSKYGLGKWWELGSGLDTLNGKIIARGGTCINVADYDIYPDGTDITDKFIALLEHVDTTGGGCIEFGTGTYRIDSLIRFPNDGEFLPHQSSIRITGTAGFKLGNGSDPPLGGTQLDLRHSSGLARFITNGVGFITFENLIFNSINASASIPFIFTTNTTLNVRNCFFYGRTANTSADEDAIILGAHTDDPVPHDGADDAPFQGYGTVIENNTFQRIRRGVYGGTYANAVVIRDNTFWTQCGGEAAIEFDDPDASSTAGNVIIGNLIELVNYTYGIKINSSVGNSIIANNFYDNTHADACIYLGAGAQYNMIIEGFNGGMVPTYIDESGDDGTNTIITSEQSRQSKFTEGLRSYKVSEHLNSYGGSWVTHNQTTGTSYWDQGAATGISTWFDDGADSYELYHARRTDTSTHFILQGLGYNKYFFKNNQNFLTSGDGSPEGVVTAPKGSCYFRKDGSAGTCVYIKESGSGNTGWVPLVTSLPVDKDHDYYEVGTTDPPNAISDNIYHTGNEVIGASSFQSGARFEVTKTYSNTSDPNILAYGNTPLIGLRNTGGYRWAFGTNYTAANDLVFLSPSATNTNPTDQILKLSGGTLLATFGGSILGPSGTVNVGGVGSSFGSTTVPDATVGFYIAMNNNNRFRVQSATGITYFDIWTAASGSNRNYTFAPNFFNTGDFSLLRGTSAGATPNTRVFTVIQNTSDVMFGAKLGYPTEGGTATTISGRDADEYFTNVSIDNNLTFSSGTLGIDTVNDIATKYDISLATGGGMMDWLLAASGTGGTESISDGETVTITGAGINTATRSGANVTITGTEVDGDASNELQTLANTSDATSHTVTLSDAGGSLQLAEGTGITLTTTGDADDGIVTIASTITDTDDQGLTIEGSGPTYNIAINDGSDVTIQGAGIITLSESPANTLVITGTEVDGSTSNEIQDITVTGASQPFTLDLGSDATDATFTGAGITTVTRSGNALTWTSTEVDGSTTNELSTVKIDNAAVSTGPPVLDFSSTDFSISESPTDEFNITLQAERIQDIVGAMVTGNTETDITVTYQDADGTLDFVVSGGSADGNGIFDTDNIGATVPSSMAFDLTNTMNIASGLLYLDAANGEVGIGTSSPDAALDVESTGALDLIVTDVALNGEARLRLASNQGLASSAGELSFSNRDADINSGNEYQIGSISMTKSSATVPGGVMGINVSYDASGSSDNVAQFKSRESGATDGLVVVQGGLRYKWAANNTTSITLTTGDYGLTTTAAGTKTITLPDAVTGIVGQFFMIYNSGAGAGTIVITGGSSDTIHGDVTVAQNESIQVHCPAANVWVITN